MSELRAPDPTLTDHDDADDATWVHDTSTPPVAHRWGEDLLLACGDDGMGLLAVSARHARWFAVPCRECFPDAPPPGRTFADSGEDRWVAVYLEKMDPNDGPLTVSQPRLSWQVQP